ncbi:glutathione-disulfide reductase [Roseomonas elaeocarpi]|uniref:Glutathione-disulfide reductase n=1 Tax=Roseomonas elaeocarpi TaxID=907779 RepID=A0ABV6JPZ7_9PROT
MADYDFDLFVIGGGSAGVRCARISAGHGAKVGIAEERFWGGTCVNVGCVPKKIMVQAAEYGGWADDAPAFGWDIEKRGHDWNVLRQARDGEVARLSGIYRRLLEGAGVTVFEARATFIDAHTLDVGGQRVTAANIVIAVGGKPVRPDIPGVDCGMISDDLFTLEKRPERIVVVGGGYIGVEFACLLHALGSEVTLVYRQKLPLRGFDLELREGLAEALTAQGILLHPGEDLESLGSAGEDGRVVTLKSGQILETEAVMLALGRVPHTEGLGLEKAGIEVDRKGAVLVDEDQATSQKHVFAIGDVTDRVNLTPMATNLGHALADTLFGNKPRHASYENVPKAVFSSPPIGSVGMTEDEADARGKPAEVFVNRFTPMRHAITKRDGRRSVMKVIVDCETRVILGMHMLGEDAPEMMQGFAVAVVNGLTKEQLDRTIGIHPTAAEEFVTLRSPARRVGDPQAAEEDEAA